MKKKKKKIWSGAKSNHTCLSVISLDSALKKDENYYTQVFLKVCKYIEKKAIRHVNDNLSDFILLTTLMKNSYQVNLFWKTNFENVFFERVNLKKYFFKE